MTMNKFLDRYIQGERGYYYFQIEIMWGRTIQGGMFSRKADARKLLLSKLINFLDEPQAFIYGRTEEPRRKRKKTVDSCRV